MQLTVLDNLFLQREKALREAINLLTLNEVKEEFNLVETKKHIAKSILPNPVFIDKPRIVSDYSIERPGFPSPLNPLGRPQSVKIVVVEFPFIGSMELFDYSPNGGGLPIRNIYQPSSANTILIEIEMEQIDKVRTLAKAEEKMLTTRSLINRNNQQLSTWTAITTLKIEKMIEERRTELLKLYS